VLAVPPPILSRIFQELNDCMMAFHRTLALTEVPFPAPYSAATHLVLIVHWVLTPIVACTWSEQIWVATCVSFVQVFMLWSLNAIAHELENPFGKDLNDLDTYGYHRDLNERLTFLIHMSCQDTPKISAGADLSLTGSKHHLRSAHSFESFWSEQEIQRSDSSCDVKKFDMYDAPPDKVDEVRSNSGLAIVSTGCQQSKHATIQSSVYNPCDLPDLEWAVATEMQAKHDFPHEAFRIDVLNVDAPWRTASVQSGSRCKEVLSHGASHSNSSDRASHKLHVNAESGLDFRQAPLMARSQRKHKARSRSS